MNITKCNRLTHIENELVTRGGKGRGKMAGERPLARIIRAGRCPPRVVFKRCCQTAQKSGKIPKIFFKK